MSYHLGIIGNPVEHSLSPILQQHLLEIVGEVGTYEKYLVENETQLDRVIQRLRLGELDGINVTAPWKTAIGIYIDELSLTAQKLGALNTVKSVDTKLLGENTDIFGFTHSLMRSTNNSLPFENVVMLGAGGSARAVLMGLEQLKCPKLTILNRTVEHAEDLVQQLGFSGEVKIDSLIRKTLNQTLQAASLVINTLPPSGRKTFHRLQFPEVNQREKVYYDLVYAKKYLKIAQKAENAGWQIIDGLGMLIYQGIASMEFWLERDVTGKIDIESLYKKLDQRR